MPRLLPLPTLSFNNALPRHYNTTTMQGLPQQHVPQRLRAPYRPRPCACTASRESIRHKRKPGRQCRIESKGDSESFSITLHHGGNHERISSAIRASGTLPFPEVPLRIMRIANTIRYLCARAWDRYLEYNADTRTRGIALTHGRGDNALLADALAPRAPASH